MPTGYFGTEQQNTVYANFRIFDLCTPATGMACAASVPWHCQRISRHVGLHLPQDMEDY